MQIAIHPSPKIPSKIHPIHRIHPLPWQIPKYCHKSRRKKQLCPPHSDVKKNARWNVSPLLHFHGMGTWSRTQTITRSLRKSQYALRSQKPHETRTSNRHKMPQTPCPKQTYESLTTTKPQLTSPHELKHPHLIGDIKVPPPRTSRDVRSKRGQPSRDFSPLITFNHS